MPNVDVRSFRAAAPGAIELLCRLRPCDGGPATASRACDTLTGLAEEIEPLRIRVRPGEALFREGERCKALFALNGGILSLASAADETTMQAEFRFRGDWLGIDGVASGRHASTAVALATCEVWAMRLDALSVAGALQPLLLAALRQAVALEATRTRSARRTPAGSRSDLRVADFLLAWAESLLRQGRPACRIALRVAPVELAAYLDLSPDAVRGALDLLRAHGAVRWDGRRHDAIVDDVLGLGRFISGSQRPRTLQ